MRLHSARWIKVLAILVLAVSVFGAPTVSSSYAQGDSRLFPETGKTVQGKFLAYWNTHGGLAQQGFPMSEEMSEVSVTDGKTYVVQYFERAQFQLHPEFAGTPNEVLLTLLGVQFYQQKYPNGAPSQVPNNEANSVTVVETGKKLGGLFRNYWSSHGGLAQQGLPVSDEFIEVNALDGKQYKVQYFERAVFEHHPEFAGTANEVLLSQLGTFAWQAKQAPATPTPGEATPTPTSKPAPPTSTPVVACDQDVPAAKNGTITPRCGPIGTVFDITANGFTPNEEISLWLTLPDGGVFGTPAPLSIGPHNGAFTDFLDSEFLDLLGSDALGIWAITYEGEQSKHQTVVWFKIVPDSNSEPTPSPSPTSNVPLTCDTAGNVNGESRPSIGRPGDTLQFTARGFSPSEPVSYWFTLPDGSVFGTPEPVPAGFVNPDGTIGPLPIDAELLLSIAEGRWAITFEGAESHNQAIIYFCVYE
jgi:hypothetical protein